LAVGRADLEDFDEIVVYKAVSQHEAALYEYQRVVVTLGSDVIGDQVGTGVQDGQRFVASIAYRTQRGDGEELLVGVVAPGDQELPIPVAIKIGNEYPLLDAETGIDHELVKALTGGSAAGKQEQTEREATHGGQYNSRSPFGFGPIAFFQLSGSAVSPRKQL